MRRGRLRRLVSLALVASAFLASLAFGQAGNGTITGTITDPAGAVIPGAAQAANWRRFDYLHFWLVNNGIVNCAEHCCIGEPYTAGFVTREH